MAQWLWRFPHHHAAHRQGLHDQPPRLSLAKEYQFETDEVFIRKEGEDVILSRDAVL